jgi:hypothetical protein
MPELVDHHTATTATATVDDTRPTLLQPLEQEQLALQEVIEARDALIASVRKGLTQPARSVCARDGVLLRQPGEVVVQLLQAIPPQELSVRDLAYLRDRLNSDRYRAPELAGLIWRELQDWMITLDGQTHLKYACGQSGQSKSTENSDWHRPELAFLDKCGAIMRGEHF